MVPRRRGWLLNVSSVASFQPAPRLAVYAATKAYVTASARASTRRSGRRRHRHRAVPRARSRTEFQTVSNTEALPDRVPRLRVARPRRGRRRGAGGATAKGRALVVPGALYKSASWAVGHHAALAASGSPAAMVPARADGRGRAADARVVDRRRTPAAWRAGGGRRCAARCRCGCASRGSACVTPRASKRTPSSSGPSVMPVAAKKQLSPRTRSSVVSTRSRSSPAAIDRRPLVVVAAATGGPGSRRPCTSARRPR